MSPASFCWWPTPGVAASLTTSTSFRGAGGTRSWPLPGPTPDVSSSLVRRAGVRSQEACMNITRRDTLKRGLTAAGVLALVPEWALPALAQGEVDVPFTDYPGDVQPPTPRRGQSVARPPQDRRLPHAERSVLLHPALQQARDRRGRVRLKLTGLFSKPMELSLADLQSMRSVDVVNGYECSGNSPRAMQGLSSNGRFTGVRRARRAAARRRRRQGARGRVLRRRQGPRGRRLPAEHAEGAAAVRAQHHARERDEARADAGVGAQRQAARSRPWRRRCG